MAQPARAACCCPRQHDRCRAFTLPRMAAVALAASTAARAALPFIVPLARLPVEKPAAAPD